MANFPVKDFSGGMDDNYLSGNPNTSYLLSNLWIDINGKPHGRNGANCFPNRAPTLSGSTIFYGLYIGEAPFGRPMAFRHESAYYMDVSDNWIEILGPAGNTAIPFKPPNVQEAATFWQKQIIFAGSTAVCPGRIYCDTFFGTVVNGSPANFVATYKTVTLGLPPFAITPSLSGGGSGSNAYGYAFHYRYDLTDYQGTVFEDKSGVVFNQIFNITTPDLANVSISFIPVLTNTSGTNYDVTNVLVDIYRTQANGITYNLIGSITNGTVSFTDSVSDNTAINGQELYTDGGILNYDQPPVGAAYVTQVNDFFWYATDQFVTQSIQGNPGACPSSFYQFTEQKIIGLSSIVGFPILFCDRVVSRIEGNYDEQGNDGFDLRKISDTAGCKSNRSIVPVPGGLVWAGNGGFYFTDGYQVTRISKHLNLRYQTWVNPFIIGTYDPDKNLVIWTATSSIASTYTYTDLMVVLHLNFGISERSVFTTWRSDRFSMTTLAYTDSQEADPRFVSRLLGFDYRGYMLTFDDTVYTDPRLNTDFYPSQFSKSAIIYRYESSAMDFGDDSTRKFCTEMTCEMGTDTNLSVQFLTRRDDGGIWKPLSEVRSDLPGGPGAILWNISEYPWNGPNDLLLHDWNSLPITEAKRQLPTGILRSNRRHICFTNSMTQIARSDDLGVANSFSDPSFGYLVLLSNPLASWPDDCEDYQISFDNDGYTKQYVIKSRDSATQIALYDPFGTLGSVASRKWQIKGYRKFERPFILSYTIFFDEGGEVTQAPQRGNIANGLVNG